MNTTCAGALTARRMKTDAFVDYRTNLRTTQNTIVYGHNMRTGTMFETLLQYRDMNFYKEHPTLEPSTVSMRKGNTR